MRWPDDPGIAGVVAQVSDGVVLPRLRLVRRTTVPQRLADVAGRTRHELAALLAGRRPGPVAVAVGSRGIADLTTLVGSTVDELRLRGWQPFVVPAMGSHGGGSAEGQREVLAGYGISERTLGVPVRATMDTVVVGEVDGHPVHLDRNVAEAGTALLVCRVKPHTDFQGPIESGAAKMAAIGLGKRTGAAGVHALGTDGLRDVMPALGRFVAREFLLGAVAVVENESDQTAEVRGLRPDEIGGPAETALLERARSQLPRLPTRRIDALVVDRMGKDVSGTGMDPNVIGRWLVPGLAEPADAEVRCVVALGLTGASHGNAIGIGLADFVPARLVEQIELPAFYLNTMTSGWAGLRRGRLPLVLPTDRDAIRVAAAVGRGAGTGALRLVWIADTLHTRTCGVSEALWPEVAATDGLELVGEPFELGFGPDGTLTPLDRVVASLAPQAP